MNDQTIGIAFAAFGALALAAVGILRFLAYHARPTR